jgi:hypothetical protein
LALVRELPSDIAIFGCPNPCQPESGLPIGVARRAARPRRVTRRCLNTRGQRTRRDGRPASLAAAAGHGRSNAGAGGNGARGSPRTEGGVCQGRLHSDGRTIVGRVIAMGGSHSGALPWQSKRSYGSLWGEKGSPAVLLPASEHRGSWKPYQRGSIPRHRRPRRARLPLVPRPRPRRPSLTPLPMAATGDSPFAQSDSGRCHLPRSQPSRAGHLVGSWRSDIATLS